MGGAPRASALPISRCSCSCAGAPTGLSGRTYLNIALTQAQIADTIGLSIVHTNKSLQALRKSNIIEWTPDRIGIHDLQAAMAYAKYDVQPESPPALYLGWPVSLRR